jgi:hypothetical protein
MQRKQLSAAVAAAARGGCGVSASESWWATGGGGSGGSWQRRQRISRQVGGSGGGDPLAAVVTIAQRELVLLTWRVWLLELGIFCGQSILNSMWTIVDSTAAAAAEWTALAFYPVAIYLLQSAVSHFSDFLDNQIYFLEE